MGKLHAYEWMYKWASCLPVSGCTSGPIACVWADRQKGGSAIGAVVQSLTPKGRRTISQIAIAFGRVDITNDVPRRKVAEVLGYVTVIGNNSCNIIFFRESCTAHIKRQNEATRY